MSAIMVVDDMALFRDPIAAILRLAGFTTSTASDGKTALALLPREKPDLILLDLGMPGMDGLSFIKALRADADRTRAGIPIILLTALSDKNLVVEARKLGVNDYLLKASFSSAVLLDRVRKHLAASSAATTAPSSGTAAEPSIASAAINAAVARTSRAIDEFPRLLDRDASLKRVEEALHGKGLSGVVAQVIAMATSPRTDMAELASLISSDPMLSVRILQAANSAAFASSKGVTNLREAVRVVGCSTVRNAAVAMGIFDAMPENSEDGFNSMRCWQHSFAVARLCELLVGEGAETAGVAYLIGLCHDLCEVLFHSHFAAEYHKILEAQRLTGLPRDQLEKHMLGMTHGELVVSILSLLNLPSAIVAPIEQLHSSNIASHSPMGRVLHMAELYANGLLLASGPGSTVAPLSQLECRHAVKHPAPPPPPTPFCAEIKGLTVMLARLSRADEAKLAEPLFARTTARIYLVRDATMSAFDPLHAALQAMATIDVRQELPRADEMKGYAGVVIVGGLTTGMDSRLTELRRALDVQGRTLSALWLAAHTVSPETTKIDNLHPRPWTITLQELAAFVSDSAKSCKPLLRQSA
jgi:DNA-binding response OmpR family regulator/HD-like signal output (HDOD) protein